MSRQSETCPTLSQDKSHTFEPDGAPDRNRLIEPQSHSLSLKSVSKCSEPCRSVSTVPHFVPHLATVGASRRPFQKGGTE